MKQAQKMLVKVPRDYRWWQVSVSLFINEQSSFAINKNAAFPVWNIKGRMLKTVGCHSFAFLLGRIKTKGQNKDPNAEPSLFNTVESVSLTTSLPVSLSVTSLTRQPAITSGSQLTSWLLKSNPSILRREAVRAEKHMMKYVLETKTQVVFYQTLLFSVEARVSRARKLSEWEICCQTLIIRSIHNWTELLLPTLLHQFQASRCDWHTTTSVIFHPFLWIGWPVWGGRQGEMGGHPKVKRSAS